MRLCAASKSMIFSPRAIAITEGAFCNNKVLEPNYIVGWPGGIIGWLVAWLLAGWLVAWLVDI
eukprot:2707758-Heterocapsa_arctica.AAC.1